MTGKILKSFDEMTDEQLETALATATACFVTSRRKTLAERAVVIAKAASLLRARSDEFLARSLWRSANCCGGSSRSDARPRSTTATRRTAAQRKTVPRISLVILPPWINKYYILDLQPKNSMVHYLVEEGFTVFMVSWRNPDASLGSTTIEDSLTLGRSRRATWRARITGGLTVNVMGYCIGGTLLAITLAWLAAKGDERFGVATFMVSLQDFSKVGDTAVFLGKSTTVDFIEQQMLERGYLDSHELSNMFSLLRSNDLIWANVVNNYLLGQKPPAFDLLYWNSDGTRMARAAHSWYLRNTYIGTI